MDEATNRSIAICFAVIAAASLAAASDAKGKPASAVAPAGVAARTADLEPFTHTAFIPAGADLSSIRFESVKAIQATTARVSVADERYCQAALQETGGSLYCPYVRDETPVPAYRVTYSFSGPRMASDEYGGTLFLFSVNMRPEDLSPAVRVLAAAARKLGNFDLLMLGREAGDWGAGQTGGLLAEELGLPCVSFADRVESAGGKLRIRRQTDLGWELLEVGPPVVVTVTNDEHNVPRIPKVRDVMMSYRQTLTQWTVDDLGIDAPAARAGNAYYEIAELFIPQKDMQCEFVAGETPEEKVETFAKRLAAVTGAL